MGTLSEAERQALEKKLEELEEERRKLLEEIRRLLSELARLNSEIARLRMQLRGRSGRFYVLPVSPGHQSPPRRPVPLPVASWASQAPPRMQQARSRVAATATIAPLRGLEEIERLWRRREPPSAWRHFATLRA